MQENIFWQILYISQQNEDCESSANEYGFASWRMTSKYFARRNYKVGGLQISLIFQLN